jgi:hypothetical protein
MQVLLKLKKSLIVSCWFVTLPFLVPTIVSGQSTDLSTPTPVSTNDIVGSITARDLGDSRMTQHFYHFAGMPGDVLITVKSNNLNGDVDVFTAGTLRPLLKFQLYAESASPATKGIYLRRREELILRVEARSPNDDEGSYQVRFGGSFEAIASPLIADAEKKEPAEPLARVGKGRRVSSVGARINEPQPPPEEVAATPPVETPSPVTNEPVKAEPPRTSSTRRGRGRVPATRRTSPPPASEGLVIEKKEPETTEKKEAEKTAAVEPRPTTPTRRGGRRGARAVPATPAEPEPPSGPRLILELLDGTRVEQYMSTIRRVTIENNQIVVVRKDGKIDRTRMTDVVRMAIEP